MKIHINYIDDAETLKRWNFVEPAIEFYDDYQHTAIPISKVNGYQIKVMLDSWRTLESMLIEAIRENLRSIFKSEKEGRVMPQYDHLDLNNWPSAEEIVRHDLQPYFDAVVKEVARHVPEKGYGYKEKKAVNFMIPHLKELSWKIYKMLSRVGQIRAIEDGDAIGDNPGELLDHTAMSAFIWSHLQGVWSQNTHEKRSKEVKE